MLPFLKKNIFIILFVLLLITALYLRFYNIEYVLSFGWDQARDAWKVRDILMGQLVLNGPKTGIGSMFLGPLYFYFLAPFFALFNLDPMASNYFNIIVNIITFVVLYFVTKRLFSEKAALFAIFLYGASHYIIRQNQIPWNVSLVPVTTLAIFYVLYQIRTGGARYFYILLGCLLGLYFHIHFTFVFLPPIILLSLFPYGRQLKNLLWIGVSFIIAGLFLIPTLMFDLQTSHGEAFKYQDFIKHYVHGIHLRYYLYMIGESLIQIQTILYFPYLSFAKYLIPFLFFILLLFERNTRMRTIGFLIMPWFIIPYIGFSIYAGPRSDYYYLFQVPLVIYIFIYLQSKLLSLNKNFLILLILIWSYYAYENTKSHWIKTEEGGLAKQKAETRERIKSGEKIEFNEGVIQSYLYIIWTKDYPLNE